MTTLSVSHMGVAGWIAMYAAWLIMIGLIVWVVFRVLPDTSRQEPEAAPTTPRPPSRRRRTGPADL